MSRDEMLEFPVQIWSGFSLPAQSAWEQVLPLPADFRFDRLIQARSEELRVSENPISV